MTTTSNISKPEFEEIAHSGGQVTFHVVTQPDGRRSYQVGWHHCRPVASAIIAVYAPVGIPVCPVNLGGMGSPGTGPRSLDASLFSSPPTARGNSGSSARLLGILAWRCVRPTACPYCGLRAGGHKFLDKRTKALCSAILPPAGRGTRSQGGRRSCDRHGCRGRCCRKRSPEAALLLCRGQPTKQVHVHPMWSIQRYSRSIWILLTMRHQERSAGA